MSVQTAYFWAPDRGYPGTLLDIGNGHKLFHSVAQEWLNVGVGVAQGDDLVDPQGDLGFKVALPNTAVLTKPAFIGVTVRIAELTGTPPNTQTSVPVYLQDQLVTYMVKGAMWIYAIKDIPAARNPVYVEDSPGGGYPLGTLIPDDDAGFATLLPGAYFEKITLFGNVVKLVII